MLGFFIWYLIGVIPTAFAVYIINYRLDFNLKYGDVLFILLFGFGGLATLIAVAFLGLMSLVVKFTELKIWKKPVFAKSRYKD
jgi:hypothetical protein